MRWFLILCVAFASLVYSTSPVMGAMQEDVFLPISTQQVDTKPSVGCEGCTECGPAGQNDTRMPFHEFPFVLVALALAVLLVVKKNTKMVLFWTVGLTIFMGMAFSLAQQQESQASPAVQSIVDTLQTQSTAQGDQTQSSTVDTTETDVFLPIDDDDEFQPFDESSASLHEEKASAGWLSEGEMRNLTRVLIALLTSIVAGFAFRFSKGRNFRMVFLLASVVYLGFYSGGCPCMISSIQNLILFLLGEPTQWISLVWILGLLPITYFFGKIWCGWICHLGAVQEFLYRPGKVKILQKPGVQKVFKAIRLVALATLIVQLIVTRTNLYITIDPFKAIFNLSSAKVTVWVLVGILLVSSLLIYRPFCRAFCPVGLVLGWVEKIPGASKLQIEPTCKSCNQCNKKCSYQAIGVDEKKFSIDNSECIRCGDCVDTCCFDSIKRGRLPIRK